jgi:hypothetical protein
MGKVITKTVTVIKLNAFRILLTVALLLSVVICRCLLGCP